MHGLNRIHLPHFWKKHSFLTPTRKLLYNLFIRGMVRGVSVSLGGIPIIFRFSENFWSHRFTIITYFIKWFDFSRITETVPGVTRMTLSS